MHGLEVLERHNVTFNTLTTVNRANSVHPLDVYRFLRGIGSEHMQFIPIVERKAHTQTSNGLTLILPAHGEAATVTPWSVEPLAFGTFLSSIFDEWVRHDVGRVYIQTFEVALQSWLGVEQSLCIFRKKCGSALAMEHTGDVYSCDHFVYPEHLLGNIAEHSLSDLVSSPTQQDFGSAKSSTLPRYCRECPVRFACNGECPKHRFLHTPHGEPGLNYLCAGYKHLFNHIDPHMQFMAQQLRNGLPPAAIMHLFNPASSQSHPSRTPGRNEPCTCGSGLKYKRCCSLNS
jgi:uncharacterized protein